MIRVEYVGVSLLKNHDRNPRRIDEQDFEILKTSIKDNPAYFEVRPILCTPDYVVFAGNMRLRAAKALGLKEVPVAVMDIPEDKQRELMVRDNVSNGVWDADILGADYEIAELKGWGYDPIGSSNMTPGTPGDADVKRWEYECPECGNKHIFTKKDLKPYDGE